MKNFEENHQLLRTFIWNPSDVQLLEEQIHIDLISSISHLGIRKYTNYKIQEPHYEKKLIKILILQPNENRISLKYRLVNPFYSEGEKT